MNKLIFFFLYFPTSVLACPYCSGASDNKSDVRTTIVIFVFIALTYIPYYLIFRKIWQYRNSNQVPKESSR